MKANTKPAEEVNSSDDEISLKDVIFKLAEWHSLILSKWRLILLVGIFGAMCGFMYAYLKKPIYIASCTFVLEDGDVSGGLGQYAGIASMVGLDFGGGGGGGIFEGDNIIELYKSRSMIEKTLLTKLDKDQLLIDRYLDFTGLRDKWSRKDLELSKLSFSQGTTQSSRLKDSILGSIVDHVRENVLHVSKPDKKLNIIKVEVESLDEVFAKSFNDQVVENVNDFYIQTKTMKALQNVAILQQKTDSVRAVMNGAIYNAVAVADATPNLNPTRQVQRVAPIQKAQFSAETNKAILGELVKNLEMSKMALHKETPLIQIIDTPKFPLKKEKPQKGVIVLVSTVLAIFIASLYVIFKEYIHSIMKK